jgi:hypothetical protein
MKHFAGRAAEPTEDAFFEEKVPGENPHAERKETMFFVEYSGCVKFQLCIPVESDAALVVCE